MSKKPSNRRSGHAHRPVQRMTPTAAQGVFLSAALIVKNEQDCLPACLASLQGVVDEVVVYDTGSTDDTVAIAEASGATVVRGGWPGDFATARNRALEMATGTWVISVDADEVLHTDASKLRMQLRRTDAPAFTVLIHNVVGEGGQHDFDHRGARLFRRRGARWDGHIHELPSTEGPGGEWEPLPTLDCPAAALSIVHYGYPDVETVAVKCERNADILQTEVRRLAALPEPPPVEHVGRMLAHLIRSEVGRQDRQAALDVGAVLAEMLPDDPVWPQSVDRLANIALGWGSPQTALAFIRRLRDSGATPPWAAFLEAEALRRMGEHERAWELMRPLRDLVDTIGVQYPEIALHESKAFTAALARDFVRAGDEVLRVAPRSRAELLVKRIAQDPATSSGTLEGLAAALERRAPELAGQLRGAPQAA
jgi:hypothetical protein